MSFLDAIGNAFGSLVNGSLQAVSSVFSGIGNVLKAAVGVPIDIADAAAKGISDAGHSLTGDGDFHPTKTGDPDPVITGNGLITHSGGSPAGDHMA